MIAMSGYYRFPTIHEESVVFVCEDDLWAVPAEGGIARRLTANLAQVGRPCLSPDGEWVAFVGREEGPPEVYLMPALGGEQRRLTYQGASPAVVGWSADGGRILYSSGAGQPFGQPWIWALEREGGDPERLPYGPAHHISWGPDGRAVLGRHTADPARWKRYRGGTAGQLWIEVAEGEFHPLRPTEGNLTTPLWLGDRIYFISDHEGIGNLYSCLPDGSEVRRHTHHQEYYCRCPHSDGRRIVYDAGADLFVYDPAQDAARQVVVEWRSPRTQRHRRFVDSARFLNGHAIHPEGHALALTVRGQLFTMANWEGAVLQHGEPDGVRYRLADWLPDGARLVAVSDAGGEEALEIHPCDGDSPPVRLADLDIGRATALAVSSRADQALISNHRFQLLLVDLQTGELRELDRSPHHGIAGMAWSPDGRWVAYGFAATERTCSIKLCRVETGETWLVTPPEFWDGAPAWDPEGRYLYFLSRRVFNPVQDHQQFDLGFPKAGRPMLITLSAGILNPFVPVPRALEEPKKEDNNQARTGREAPPADAPGEAEGEEREEGASEPADGEPQGIEIDLQGIETRVVAFPLPEGRYSQIAGIPGKVLVSSFPVEGALGGLAVERDAPPRGILQVWDFREQRHEVVVRGISSFTVARDGKTLLYRAGDRLRVARAGPKVKDNDVGAAPGRASGWIDLGRVKASVIPLAEWRQMYREAWRLQREHFWCEDMSGVDWERVYQRYLPLLERVATRSEFSDLMWEMQGELGTSHCYEFGGDYRPSPQWGQGFLGADVEHHPETDGYRIVHVVQGDPWEETGDSPFNEPGINVAEGDVLLSIGGQRLGRHRSPGEALVGLAGQEVQVALQPRDGSGPRTVTIKALSSEGDVRYREWVRANRDHVHRRTGGRAGYVHVPDMGPRGYAEFHRGYLAEIAHPGLIVDVRFNGGGFVSELILEKLARRRIGYDVRRWGQPAPYPYESVMGPIVALTNENAGSDGDIFCHSFKLMRLGPLIGKRTWGGVIGISPHQTFVDGGLTTQPEYSFWFVDVGWAVENYGTDPDIEVDYPPQDYVAGRDPQLERAIAEIERLMEEQPPRLPEFGERPRRTLPGLPGAGS